MKNAVILAGLIALTAGSSMVYAEGRGGPGGRGQMPSFEELDLNGDGFVTIEEMQAQGEARFEESDLNGDGEVTVEELAEKIRANADEAAARMLERGDKNEDGVITLEEMSRDGDMAERMFERVDQDGDGQISAEEFAAMQEHMQDRRGRHGRGQE